MPQSTPPHDGAENVQNELSEASFPDGFEARSELDFWEPGSIRVATLIQKIPKLIRVATLI